MVILEQFVKQVSYSKIIQKIKKLLITLIFVCFHVSSFVDLSYSVEIVHSINVLGHWSYIVGRTTCRSIQCSIHFEETMFETLYVEFGFKITLSLYKC